MRIGSSQSDKADFSAQRAPSNKQDPRVQAIQKQIDNVRKQLSEVSANENMSLEQKRERRKQLNEQIQELSKRLNQIQMEIQKENTKKAQESQQSSLKDTYKTESDSYNEFSIDLAAVDLYVKQAKSSYSMKTKAERHARILESEINMDRDRGLSTEKKEAELSDLKDSALMFAKKIGESAHKASENVKNSENQQNDNDEKQNEKYEGASMALLDFLRNS